MRPEALLGHLVELLTLGFSARGGLDREAQAFFSARRYLGSHERAWLSTQAWPLWRRRLAWQAMARTWPGGERWPEAWRAVLMAGHVPELPLSGWLADQPPATLPNILRERWPDLAPHLGEAERWVSHVYAVQWADLPPGAPERSGWPAWLATAYHERCQQLGVDEETMADHWEGWQQAAPLTVRVNTLKSSRASLLQQLAGEGVPAAPGVWVPEALHLQKRVRLEAWPLFRQGALEVQDEGSQLIARALNPQPGWHVLDACAGGGGKSLHLVALMGNQGAVLATDRSRERVLPLHERARRAGAGILRIVPPREAAVQRKLDAVLIDAPCSGVGTVRRHPELLWRLNPDAPPRHAVRQQELLAHYAPCVCPGGLLVYATCSFLEVENDGVIAAFLKTGAPFSVISVEEQWIASGLQPLDPKGIVGATRFGHQLLPALHGTDGFFVSVLRRTSA